MPSILHRLPSRFGETRPAAVVRILAVVGKFTSAASADMCVPFDDISLLRVRRPPFASAGIRAELARPFVRQREDFFSAHRTLSRFHFFGRMSSAPAFHRIYGQFEFGGDLSVPFSFSHEPGNHYCLFIGHIKTLPVPTGHKGAF